MEAILIILTILFISWLFIRIFWKGLVIFCSRHGKLGPYLYFVFLFPIAFFHIFFIGFGDKKTTFSKKDTALNKKDNALNKKDNALNKKEAAKKLFLEIKAENKKIATAQEEQKKETGQNIKRASQRGLNDISGWKFKCIGCNKDVHLKCSNCGHIKFKRTIVEIPFSSASSSPVDIRFECLKCKEQKIFFRHNFESDCKTFTDVDKHPNRFSKSDTYSWFKKYDC